MEVKILSLILGLAVLGSLGGLYLSQNRTSAVDAFSAKDTELFGSLDADELHYRLSLFKDWIVEYDRQYSAAEIPVRFTIWNKNYELVQEHNSRNETWEMGINQFSDLTDEEFSALYLGLNAAAYNEEEEADNIEILDESDLALGKDWRKDGYVTSVKNQGQCGDCYAFASAGGLEYLYKKKKGSLVSLSFQQIADCSSKEGNNGCNGGLMTNSYKYTKSAGIEKASDYPQTSTTKSCKHKSSKSVLKNTGYSNVKKDYRELKKAVSRHPVPVGVEAASAIKSYKNGVITKNCGTSLDHAVLVVGYSGSDWIVKNSWGSSWGESGYFRLRMGDNNLCGINNMATYPVIKE